MIDSILTSVKKALNLPADHTEFDEDIIMHINTVFSTIHQLGVGPEGGFMITDETALWSTFLGANVIQNNIRSYMYLCVRMLFDPPDTGYKMTSMKEQAKELEWRINVDRETIAWVDPDPPTIIDAFDGCGL